MDFMLSRATRVTAQWASAPVQHAVARFWRDMEMTSFHHRFCAG